MFEIKQITPKEAIMKALENRLTIEYQIIISMLRSIAEQAVNLQRDLGEEYRGKSADELKKIRQDPHKPNYIDDTGHLRQSIGYMIAVDGEPLQMDFKSDKSRELAQKALEGNQQGIVLILTAGMEYAAYVSKKGYDVLDSAEIFCKQSLQKLISKYKK